MVSKLSSEARAVIRKAAFLLTGSSGDCLWLKWPSNIFMPAHVSRNRFWVLIVVPWLAVCKSWKLEIELVYYPPYHSKLNAVERCWGALEQHWNGTLLTSISTTLNWARSMTWKKLQPVVRVLNGIYRRGVKLTKNEIAPKCQTFTKVAIDCQVECDDLA